MGAQVVELLDVSQAGAQSLLGSSYVPEMVVQMENRSLLQRITPALVGWGLPKTANVFIRVGSSWSCGLNSRAACIAAGTSKELSLSVSQN